MTEKNEKFANRGRNIANDLESLRLEIFQSCTDEEKQYIDDKLFSLQSQIRDLMYLVEVSDFN